MKFYCWLTFSMCLEYATSSDPVNSHSLFIHPLTSTSSFKSNYIVHSSLWFHSVIIHVITYLYSNWLWLRLYLSSSFNLSLTIALYVLIKLSSFIHVIYQSPLCIVPFIVFSTSFCPNLFSVLLTVPYSCIFWPQFFLSLSFIFLAFLFCLFYSWSSFYMS